MPRIVYLVGNLTAKQCAELVFRDCLNPISIDNEVPIPYALCDIKPSDPCEKIRALTVRYLDSSNASELLVFCSPEKIAFVADWCHVMIEVGNDLVPRYRKARYFRACR